MNFQGKAVLVYLEEDNIARAYFRVQPLLTQDGPVQAEALAAFPDEGFLRIVPDKNEQHTFKERMRSMCGLCMVDLRFQPAEANKIRTNKNYSPSRGENNQYIIYSDAVRLIPEDLFYQVVAEGNVQSASTPYVYIRNGANIQGPFRREDGQSTGEVKQLPPDSAEIHAITLNNGQEALFYWPVPVQEEKAPAAEEAPAEENTPLPETAEAPAASAEEQPAPAPAAEEIPAAIEEKQEAPAQQNVLEQIREMNTGLSENANRLHAPSASPVNFMAEQPQKPLTGTKLYQAPQKAAVPRRAHNPLMEAVDQQRYAAKYEAPGAVLPQSAEFKDVSNPVDAFKRALQGLWLSPDAQRQAVDVLLTQPSMRNMLSKALASEDKDLTLTAMKGQLQEMEAERLMALMQLDDVKKNLAAAREEAIGQMTKEEQKALDDLKEQQKKAAQDLEALKAAMPAIEEQRQKAADLIAQAANMDENLGVIRPAAGTAASRKDLIARVEKAMQAAGFRMEKGDAQAMLVSYALSGKNWQIAAANLADAYSAVSAFAAALGAPMQRESWRSLSMIPGGNGPVFLLDAVAPFHSPLITGVIPCTDHLDRYAEDDSDYFESPFACVPVQQDPDALPKALPAFAPVSKASIVAEMVQESKLNDETVSAIVSLRKAIAKSGAPLALSAVEMICRFISSTQQDLGVAEALDRAVCLFAVPHLLMYKISLDEIKPLLAAMPRTLKALKKA